MRESPRRGRRGWAAVRVACAAALLPGCIHAAQPEIPLPAPTAPIHDPDVLPFELPLDAELQRTNPGLYATLVEMDRAGDKDGVFTRGDAMAAGVPQLFGDLHTHPFMQFAAAPIFRGLPSSARSADDPATILTTQLTIPELNRGATNLLFAYAYVPDVWAECAKGRDGKMGEALCQLTKARQFARAHAESMAIAESAAEAREIARGGRIAIILCVEGGDIITRVEDVDLLYRAGVRVLTIAHFVTNRLAGAAAASVSHFDNPNFLDWGEPSPGGYRTNPAGLTPLGVAVVQRMVQVGMLVDLTHASDATVRDVLEATKESRAPVVFSHSAMRAIHPTEHNVSDDTIRLVAERGGVIGLVSYRVQLMADGLEECHAFATHFRHLLEVAGPEHVALGSDFNGFVTRVGPCREGGKGIAATGLRNAGDTPGLLQSLADEGVPPKVIQGMGENLLRVLATAEAKASAPAPARVERRRH